MMNIDKNWFLDKLKLEDNVDVAAGAFVPLNYHAHKYQLQKVIGRLIFFINQNHGISIEEIARRINLDLLYSIVQNNDRIAEPPSKYQVGLSNEALLEVLNKLNPKLFMDYEEAIRYAIDSGNSPPSTKEIECLQELLEILK